MELSLATIAVLFLSHTDFVLAECPSGCTSCNGQICKNCEPSYYLEGKRCLTCPEHCLSCTGQTNCTECKANKWGTGEAQCITDCSEVCLNDECNDHTGYCLSCEHGKYGGWCQYKCSDCENEHCDLYRCVEGCKSGYFEYQTSNIYLCQKCSTNCKECDNGVVCRICNAGYYLNKYHHNGNTYVTCSICPNENKCSNFCIIEGCNQCQLVNNWPMCADCPEGETFNGVSCEQNGHQCSRCPTNCGSNETLVTINTTATSTTTTPCTQNQASEDKVMFTIIGFFFGIGFSLVIVAIVTLLYFIRRRYFGYKTTQNNSRNVEIPTYTESANNYESLSHNRTRDNVYSDLGTTE